MKSVQEVCSQLDCFIQASLPNFWARMQSTQFVDCEIIALPWFLTLFSTDFKQSFAEHSRPLGMLFPKDLKSKAEFMMLVFTLLALEGQKAAVKLAMCLFSSEMPKNTRLRS